MGLVVLRPHLAEASGGQGLESLFGVNSRRERLTA
jgi:hypothetical protein